MGVILEEGAIGDYWTLGQKRDGGGEGQEEARKEIKDNAEVRREKRREEKKGGTVT